MKIIKYVLNILLNFVLAYISIAFVAQAPFDFLIWSDAHNVGFAVIFTMITAIDNFRKQQ